MPWSREHSSRDAKRPSGIAFVSHNIEAMNAVSQLRLPGGTLKRIKHVSTPVWMDGTDVQGQRERGNIIWIGNSPRVLIGNELHPIRCLTVSEAFQVVEWVFFGERWLKR